jgi:nitrogenase molybdenum-iron protein alpha/beta subunit
MLNFCDIVVAILKMATGRNCSMSGVCHFQNGHHNTAKIQHCPISSKFDMWVGSNNVEFLRYCGGHFENGDQ